MPMCVQVLPSQIQLEHVGHIWDEVCLAGTVSADETYDNEQLYDMPADMLLWYILRRDVEVCIVGKISFELAASRCVGYEVVLRKSVDIVAFEELRSA